MRSTLMEQNSITLGQLEYACETLNRLYHACHWRKIEMYLIPAIRQATERADQLLDELGRLNQMALDAIRTLQSLQSQYGALADGRDQHVGRICDSIEAFCAAMLQRLEKEEQELFDVARRVIGGEAWFSIANQLMLHDKQVEEARRAPQQPAHPQRPPQRLDGESAWDRAGGIPVPSLAVLPMVRPEPDSLPTAARRPARQTAAAK
ncbi:hypothetical protein ACLB1G_18060 [Oxalobacteraceae bacterium A2-2]